MKGMEGMKKIKAKAGQKPALAPGLKAESPEQHQN
jgi:hypothetical protein